MDIFTLDKLENWIRKGAFFEAKSLILSQTKKTISRKYLLRFAELARRAGLPKVGISVLNPIVRTSGRKKFQTASYEEKAEYAASLIRIGAEAEALGLLNQIRSETPPSKYSQVDLFTAFAYIHQWRYEEAIPFLHQFLDHPQAPSYLKLVALTNLAASFIFIRKLKETEEILSYLIPETLKEGNTLLFLNGTELAAQCAWLKGDLSLCQALLNKCQSTILETSSNAVVPDFFYIRKWTLLLNLKKEGWTPLVQQKFFKFQNEARERADWETLRDLDYYLALETQDTQLILKIYYGTPYESYRQRLLQESGFSLKKNQSSFSYSLGESKSPQFHFDLGAASLLENSSINLKLGQVLHRVLLALSADLYRPPTLITLHSRVFPDRFFHPTASPNVIHQSLSRLRQWIESSHLPLKIEEHQERYFLRSKEGFVFFLPDRKKSSEELDFLSSVYNKLWFKFKGNFFSAQEVSDFLKVSKRTSLYWIQSLNKSKRLQKISHGPQTRYKISNSPSDTLQAQCSAQFSQ